LQDILVWSSMMAVFVPRIREDLGGRRSWSVAAVVSCNIALLLQMLDLQCKAVCLEPLTWRVVIESLREAGKLYSSIAGFATPKFVCRVAGSLVSLNAAPVLLSAWIGASRPVALLGKIRAPRRLARRVVLPAVPCLAVTAMALHPQPYQIDGNVLTGALVATARRLREPTRRDLSARCDQPASVPAQTSPWTGIARGRNVVMFVVETLSYAESSLGDPATDRTPLLRELSEYGPIATRARAQVPYSTKAVYSLLTGRYASPSLQVPESRAARLDSLARTLREAGYYTAFFSTQFLTWQHTGHQYQAMGFDAVLGADDLRSAARAAGRALRANSWGVDDRELVEGGLLDRLPSDRPFFAVFYNSASHHPYVYEERNRVGTDQERFRRALRYGDDAIRAVVDQLRALHHFDDTLFVMVGDHGETFEGGRTQARGCFLGETSLVVPLVIALPGAASARRDVTDARQIDVVPTVIDLLGLKPDTPVQGRSILGPQVDTTPIYLYGYGACETFGLVDGTTKFRYDAETGVAESFDLKLDSLEQHGTVLADGPAKTALVERMEACAQYDENALR
jgi:phosphoglycerol transferase MdoB-like AlkP superfamily enzyme